MSRLSSVRVTLKLPFIGDIEGTWEPDEQERRAAWEMYVELITRVPVAELYEEGLLREELSSLYSLFGTTRRILRDYGPSVAQPKSDSGISFGYLAVAILNTVVRPQLAKWHPLLLHYESTKPRDISPWDHEQQWDKHGEFRLSINAARPVLVEYANLLAQVADVPHLTQ